ncbi:MAG: metallophosphoesterase [Treponema sp.]|nr:metallophosphoesterase [Treponema sp.]
MKRWCDSIKVSASFVKLLSAVAFAVFCLLSCSNYGFFWGLFDEDDVDSRSSTVRALSDISSDYLPNVQSQTIASSSTYSVLLVTDLHFGTSREDLDENAFLEWFENLYKTSDATKIPRFIVNLGDTADGGHRSEFKDYLAFENRLKAIAGRYLYGETDDTPDDKRKFRVYSVLGNHDLYNNGCNEYPEFCFPYISSYHFDVTVDASTNGFSFYFLDTANGTMGTKQLEDFNKKLAADPKPKIVCTHYPVYAGGQSLFMILQNTLERNTILTYFAENNVKQVYEGHVHRTYGFDYKIFREDVIGSLRYNKTCALFTVNEQAGTVSTEVIEF